MRLSPLLGLLAVIAVACKPATETKPVPASMSLVQGANQQIQGGLELPNPIIVRVLGADGFPVQDVSVGFTIRQGGGAVNPGTVLSDENGEARTKWNVGTNEVTQKLEASVSGLEPITVDAIALLPSDIVVAQGNFQTAKPNAALPNPIVIRIVGPGGVPMKGVPVAFQITSGGGLISPQSGLTNALGEVTSRWTMGAGSGQNTLAVSALALSPVSLTATAQ
jgi:hypothetical protein